MKKILQGIVERRVKKFPAGNILKDSFMWVGAVFGGAHGFSDSMRASNGPIWRTTLGMVGGGAAGFTTGLYPFHVLGLFLAGDIAYTVSTNFHEPSSS